MRERGRETEIKQKGMRNEQTESLTIGLGNVWRFGFEIMAWTFDMVLSIHGCGWVVAWFTSTLGGLPV